MSKDSYSVEWAIQWPMPHEFGGDGCGDVLRSLRDAQVRIREHFAIDHDGRRVPADHDDACYWWARIIIDVEGDTDDEEFHPVDASTIRLEEINECIETLDWRAA